LAANPQRPEFSTISSDGHVNVWTPKSRHRNGMPVLDRVGSQLYTWTCANTIEVSVPLRRPVATASALAYSTDGSALAVSSNKSPFIHFIDPLTGAVQYTLHGSHPGLFSYLTFVKHHLVTISKDLRVYNTVSGDLLYALALNSSVCDIQLAANQHDQTFAAVCLLPAFMSKENGGFAKARSQIMVFDLKSATPIFRKIVDGTVEILLSLPGESGYLIINDEAEVVYLRRPGSNTTRRIVEVPHAEEPLRMTMGLEDVFGKRSIEARQEANGMITNLEEDEKEQIMQDYKAHSSLSEVFNNHTTNLSVRELFEQVVGVIKRKEFRRGTC
jgi:WD40 repeat protein